MRILSNTVVVLLACVAAAFAAGELSGRRAPGFSLPDSRLVQYDLQDYRGKLVLIEIMQTTCPHCREFSKVLEEVKKKYAGRVAILTVVTPPDNQSTVAGYIAETKTTVPIVFDCGQMTASYLKITPRNPSIHVPHLFLIDGNGMIRNDFGYGPATKEIFEGRALFRELEKILNAPAAGKK